MIGCEFCRRTGKELSSKLCNKIILPGYRDRDTPADYFFTKYTLLGMTALFYITALQAARR